MSEINKVDNCILFSEDKNACGAIDTPSDSISDTQSTKSEIDAAKVASDFMLRSAASIRNEVEMLVALGHINAEDKELEIQKRIDSLSGIKEIYECSLRNRPHKKSLSHITPTGKQAVGAEARRLGTKTLVELGFSEQMAQLLIHMRELSLPLSDDVLTNIKLLKQYITLNEIPEAPYEISKVFEFLKRSPDLNIYMAEALDRYAFTNEERRTYSSNPFDWCITYNLRESIGEALNNLVNDPELTERILCGMNIYGSIMRSSEDILSIIKALVEINTGYGLMHDVVNKNRELLFSQFWDVTETIKILSGIFRRECVLRIFNETCPWLPLAVRDSRDRFLWNTEEIIQKLKGKYADCLK